MSDIKLFRLGNDGVTEIQGSSVALEKSLQTLIERHLVDLLGVRFLASEYSTGAGHGGRMDTLGIDENGFPVIIEYKRSSNENVINQGLFYLDWLMDHRKDFQWLVLDKVGKEAAESVDWSAPRLLCIAGDFSKYDEHAVNQMNRNIELIRYRRYAGDLLLFELVNAASAPTKEAVSDRIPSAGRYKTVSQFLKEATPEVGNRYETLKAHLLALGDDVQIKTLKNYFAFKRIKNFACVEVHNRTRTLAVYVKVDPDTVDHEKGFTRDVRKIGHFGTGDLEITIRNDEDLERALPLIEKSYETA